MAVRLSRNTHRRRRTLRITKGNGSGTLDDASTLQPFSLEQLLSTQRGRHRDRKDSPCDWAMCRLPNTQCEETRVFIKTHPGCIGMIRYYNSLFQFVFQSKIIMLTIEYSIAGAAGREEVTVILHDAEQDLQILIPGKGNSPDQESREKQIESEPS